jgi:hypothetical protein
MSTRLRPNVDRITNGTNGIGISKYYVCYWPKQNIEESYYDSHLSEFATLDKTLVDAFKLAGGGAGLNVESTNLVKNADKEIRKILEGLSTRLTNDINNLNTTTTATPACPLPIIKTFTPNIGRDNTIVRINGAFLGTTYEVVFDTITATTKNIQIIDDFNVNVIVPKINTLIPKSIKIRVTTKNGSVTSTNDFTYNPQQTLPSTSTDVNTNPSPVTLTSTITNTGDLKVVVANNVGNWIIYPYPEYNYTITKDSVGSNNTISKTIVSQSKAKTKINSPNYVANNQFNITQNQFLLNVLELPIEVINSDKYKNSVVNVTFTVRAVPVVRKPQEQDVELSFKMIFRIG